MKRGVFYKEESVNNVPELDFLNNSLTSFVVTRRVSYYKVIQADLLRPDFISWKVYGEETYWWLIMLANNLTNARADLSVGQLLQIPDMLDIYDFYRSLRMR